MEVSTYEDGIPCWVDVSCADVAKSAEFYGALFGWDAPEGPAEFGGYRNATLQGKTVAGIGPQMDPNVPTVWSCYVKVTDAAATAGKVEAAGGSVMVPPMPIPGAGTMAIFVDTTGAVFGVWQPAEHTGAQLVNEPGTFCWSEILSSDLDKTKAFYGAVFGWDSHASEGPMPYTEWELGERTIGGGMPKPPTMPAGVPDYWNVYFAVADIDASFAQAKDLGATAMLEPMDSPAGRLATLQEPGGAVFSIIQLTGDHD
jgi:predicted enzyme related to lactoylglutathione lyase